MLNSDTSSNILPRARWTICLPPSPTRARAHITLETTVVNRRNFWVPQRSPGLSTGTAPPAEAKPITPLTYNRSVAAGGGNELGEDTHSDRRQTPQGNERSPETQHHWLTQTETSWHLLFETLCWLLPQPLCSLCCGLLPPDPRERPSLSTWSPMNATSPPPGEALWPAYFNWSHLESLSIHLLSFAPFVTLIGIWNHLVFSLGQHLSSPSTVLPLWDQGLCQSYSKLCSQGRGPFLLHGRQAVNIQWINKMFKNKRNTRVAGDWIHFF